MNIETVKDKLLCKIAEAIDAEKMDIVDFYSVVYSMLCNTDVQKRMTEAHLRDGVDTFPDSLDNW